MITGIVSSARAVTSGVFHGSILTQGSRHNTEVSV